MALSLLIVEDEEDICLMLHDRLTFLGFAITLARNGVEGVAILDQMTIDGILLDIQMPVMDGLTMLEQVQDKYPHIPVIVMSAERNKNKLILAIEQGAKDYLFKPVDIDLLSKKCSSTFSSRISQSELHPR